MEALLKIKVSRTFRILRFSTFDLDQIYLPLKYWQNEQDQQEADSITRQMLASSGNDDHTRANLTVDQDADYRTAELDMLTWALGGLSAQRVSEDQEALRLQYGFEVA